LSRFKHQRNLLTQSTAFVDFVISSTFYSVHYRQDCPQGKLPRHVYLARHGSSGTGHQQCKFCEFSECNRFVWQYALCDS